MNLDLTKEELCDKIKTNLVNLNQSELEEVYQTMYELKKTIKDLQTKLAMQNAATVELFEEDDKTAKAKRK